MTQNKSQDAIERTSDNYGNDNNNSKKPATNKRKACHKDRTGAENSRARLRDSSPTDNLTINVSDKVASIEIRCSNKEHVLLEVMETLSKIHLETQTIQSSTNDGTLSITLNAKVYHLHHECDNLMHAVQLQLHFTTSILCFSGLR